MANPETEPDGHTEIKSAFNMGVEYFIELGKIVTNANIFRFAAINPTPETGPAYDNAMCWLELWSEFICMSEGFITDETDLKKLQDAEKKVTEEIKNHYNTCVKLSTYENKYTNHPQVDEKKQYNLFYNTLPENLLTALKNLHRSCLLIGIKYKITAPSQRDETIPELTEGIE